MRPDTPLTQLLVLRYPQLRSQFTADGRRKRLLRAAEEFWTSSALLSDPSGVPNVNAADQQITAADSDPHDEITTGPELGLLLRTDYSNDGAWHAFLARLQGSESDLLLENAQDPNDHSETTDSDSALNPGGASPQTTDNMNVDMDDDDDDDSPSDTDTDPFESSIFKIIDPSSMQDRHALTDISNLAALRLFNDVDVRPCPVRPADTPRIRPPNRLIDHGGWQEIYVGKPIWIYDAKSNADQSVRVVSQQGDVYGTATADSWRARVSHICELQINIYNGMTISFGGLDGWDHGERRRNMDDVNLPVS